MPTFNSVVESLLSERQYQKRRWGYRELDGTFTERAHSIEEFTLYMDDYMTELKHVLSRTSEPEARSKGLDGIRKVVTLGLACMEQHGAPLRDLTKEIINGRDGQPA